MVYIVSAKRTPIGSFLGGLSSLTAPQLGSYVLKELVEDPSTLSEVFMGEVLTAGVGQAPARQAALGAGFPQSLPCTTVNKVCGSGLKAVAMGMEAIKSGNADCVVAGGMESMSQAPFIVSKARQGFMMGHQEIKDSMIYDGLWDPYNNQHMGNCAELCALEKKISRDEQDEYSILSYKRAQKAQKEGLFSSEIVPILLKGKKGDEILIDSDEEPNRVKFEKIPQLKPVFQKEGTITAANASSINDGAAAVLLMSEEMLKGSNYQPIAKIVAYTQHAQAPEWFTTAPVGAIEKVLKKANWSLDQVDLFEINEAFSVVALAAQKALHIPTEKLNIWGGAVALGHPIGASGARLLATLCSQLRHENKSRGVVSLCIGGGEGIAMAIEAV